MPVLAAALVLFAVLALAILLLPLSLIQRYRVGTRRRPARPWITTLNLAGVSVSSLIFLFSAALMSPWIPGAFTYAALGVAAGAVLGGIALMFTRWESTASGLHFTPPWPLVLGLTLIVTGRLLFGFWRAWHAWGLTPDAAAWLAASGAAGSLAAGAAVLGYYVAYWWGVRGRIRRHPPVRRMPPR
jgi:hypothetical protein